MKSLRISNKIGLIGEEVAVKYLISNLPLFPIDKVYRRRGSIKIIISKKIY